LTGSFLIELTVLILAAFLGLEVISKVPTLLHTPLMSGTNAIHGIVVVGAIVVAGIPGQPIWLHIVTLAAVALGTGNAVGGFVVTDRMLQMFRRRQPGPGDPEKPE
jgi:H+-translocating NAD(P) transhydrogenase subunit alpha